MKRLKKCRIYRCRTQTESDLQIQKSASQIMKKIKRRTTLKAVIGIVLIVAVIIGGHVFCNHITDSEWGYSEMLYGIASGDVEVTQLYQLSGGDIYCILKSSKSIGIQSMTGLKDPAELSDQNEEQTLEYRMRGRTFWETVSEPEIKQSNHHISGQIRRNIRRNQAGVYLLMRNRLYFMVRQCRIKR